MKVPPIATPFSPEEAKCYALTRLSGVKARAAVEAKRDAPFDGGKRRRILSDLNEHLRSEQYVDYMEGEGDELGFRPWLLVPAREP